MIFLFIVMKVDMAKGMNKGNKGNDRLKEKKKSDGVGTGKKWGEKDIAETLSTIPEWYTPEEWAEIHDREDFPIVNHSAKSLYTTMKEMPIRTVQREMDMNWYKEKPQWHIENKRNKLIAKIDDIIKQIHEMYPKKRISFDLVKKFTDVLIHHEQKFVSFSDEYNKIALALLYDIETVNNIDLTPLKLEFAKFSTQDIEDDQQELFVEIFLTEVEMTGPKILKKLFNGELMNIDAA